MSTAGLPGGATDEDGDDMPLYLEQLAGTSDNDLDSDDDGQTDWIEWTMHGTNPADADTDDDGVGDEVELGQGSDPTDPSSFLGLCGDVNRDSFIDLVDPVIVRRQLAGSAGGCPGGC